VRAGSQLIEAGVLGWRRLQVPAAMVGYCVVAGTEAEISVRVALDGHPWERNFTCLEFTPPLRMHPR
jgi:hypothetical protein